MGFSLTMGIGSQCYPEVIRECLINPKDKIWKGSRIKDNRGPTLRLFRSKIML